MFICYSSFAYSQRSARQADEASAAVTKGTAPRLMQVLGCRKTTGMGNDWLPQAYRSSQGRLRGGCGGILLVFVIGGRLRQVVVVSDRAAGQRQRENNGDPS